MVAVLLEWVGWLTAQWFLALPFVALAACLASKRATKASWRWCLRVVLRGVPMLLPVYLLARLFGELSIEHLHWQLLTLPVGPACVMMIFAGRQEAAGRLGLKRRLARIAGRFMLLGSLAGIAATGLRPDWSAAALIAVAICGLLGGLSGKPRPVGGIGLFFWLVAALVRVAGGLLN